ncbi:unnamed protein product, partial [Rotaria sordida]
IYAHDQDYSTSLTSKENIVHMNYQIWDNDRFYQEYLFEFLVELIVES